VQSLESQAGNYQGILDGSTPPSVATDEKLWSLWANRPSGPLSAPAALRAIYNLGIEHGQARSRDVAEPAPVAGGLVERVAKRLVAVFENGPYTIEACKWDESAARAAILEVAAWMRENECGYNAVRWLEQEAGR
jgi:hypothetical protein